ncbi:tetratricopeptide repeat protein [Lachnospiraceae bacterium KGMB03038]|nr:tetratricopeptide repeat protein [Lachnospiraceae bacterium KGMB03038]
MDYTMKLVYQSNYWYNDGLKKANIRDLSGAIKSLRKSLQYNQANIAARNLLGLVYYGRGDVIEGLVEWILSKNFQSHDNIANYYISKVQEVPGELEAIDQAVKKFNQSLEYARQNGEDLAIIQLKKVVSAHPAYVKAYQLLALLYIQTEQYGNARSMLRTAHKLDTTDEITLKYMHELNQIRKSRTVRIKEKEKGKEEQQTVTYSIGNETIIQPVASGFKENTGLHTIINILIGLVVGVAVMWFLIMPAVNSSRQRDTNEQTAQFSDQIATQEAQISALQKELEEYRSTSEASQDAQATAESTQESYEAVINVYQHFNANDMSDNAMLEEMLKINADSLGTLGRDRYEEVRDSLYPRMCEKLFNTSQENVNVANYESAISNLEQVMQMDAGYQDGQAMLLLAQAYEGNGDQDQANTWYQKILEDYPDTEAAASAQEALDAQNSGSSDSQGAASNGDGDSEDNASGSTDSEEN